MCFLNFNSLCLFVINLFGFLNATSKANAQSTILIVMLIIISIDYSLQLNYPMLECTVELSNEGVRQICLLHLWFPNRWIAQAGSRWLSHPPLIDPWFKYRPVQPTFPIVCGRRTGTVCLASLSVGHRKSLHRHSNRLCDI